jgi:hypothetical protein
MILQNIPALSLCTSGTESFEPNLLAMNNETFVRAFCHWQRYSHQAMCVATTRTGKMRVALMFGAVMRQFKMPGSFVYEGLVHQPDSQQTLERSINCDFIELPVSREAGNLVLAKRFVGFHQDSQNIDSAACTVKICEFQHFACFSFQI